MKSTKTVFVFLVLLAVAGFLSPNRAAAKDAVQAKVDPSAYIGPTPEFVMNNGNPLAPGTFAVGTIQLFYTVNASAFTPGAFGSFKLDLGVKKGPLTGQQTSYPVNYLRLEPIGSTNLILTPAPASFSVTQAWVGSALADSSIVTISISQNLPESLNCDGCELVANMRMTTPGGSQLDTVTNVQVHIKLVHPTSCLRLYNFLTDQSFTTLITTTNVNTGGPANNKKVVGTNPYGQFSDNALVVNECSQPQTFDLQMTMDSHFDFGPGGANANAVFTFMTNSQVVPSQFNTTNFGTGTAQEKNTFLQNITVAPHASFLVKVHMALIKGNPVGWLPSGGVFDGFSAQLFTPGTPLNALATAIPYALAVPNPATTQIAFTVQ
jgi:hypothetical protein